MADLDEQLPLEALVKIMTCLGVEYSQRPPVGCLSASKGYSCDLVSRLELWRCSSTPEATKRFLNEVLGGL